MMTESKAAGVQPSLPASVSILPCLCPCFDLRPATIIFRLARITHRCISRLLYSTPTPTPVLLSTRSCAGADPVPLFATLFPPCSAFSRSALRSLELALVTGGPSKRTRPRFLFTWRNGPSNLARSSRKSVRAPSRSHSRPPLEYTQATLHPWPS